MNSMFKIKLSTITTTTEVAKPVFRFGDISFMAA
jgi:hypothetical protein